jgi:hypothetical protein
METRSSGPAVYWVVGNSSNAGKTTIASALIRQLNAAGKRTVGFKPYAGAQLRDLIDFMFEKYPASRCKLFSKDAWKLTAASPLTDMDMIDLVGPSQAISYPVWHRAVLMRTGSAALGNVECFTNSQGASLRDRPDIRHIQARTGLPLGEATVREQIGFDAVTRESPEKHQDAFNALLDLGVDAVVCEGMANWLPVWQGCPPVNHVVLLADGKVTLLPDVDLSFSFDPENVLRLVDELTGDLQRRSLMGLSVPFYLAEESRREQVALQIVQGLVARTPELQ